MSFVREDHMSSFSGRESSPFGDTASSELRVPTSDLLFVHSGGSENVQVLDHSEECVVDIDDIDVSSKDVAAFINNSTHPLYHSYQSTSSRISRSVRSSPRYQWKQNITTEKKAVVALSRHIQRRMSKKGKAGNHSFPDKRNEQKKSCRFSRSSWVWIVVMCLMSLGGCVGIFLLVPQRPRSGNWLDFGPRETLQVKDVPNAVLLALARVAAYMMYPCVMLVLITKAHGVRSWLFTTQIRLICPFFIHVHDVHKSVGWCCLWLAWLHSVCHVIRWIRLEQLHFLWKQQTGLTGILGLVSITVASLPMGLFILRRRVSWEVRKYAHTILGLTFGICGALHALATISPIIYSAIVGIYGLDWIYVNFVTTYEVKSCSFKRLAHSVMLSFENPLGFKIPENGYVNICVPFISKYQWHALSVYPHATLPNHSSLCVSVVGDWTRELHDSTIWQTARACWIQGPFLSPYACSIDYENILCVASGSGISASLAAVKAVKELRQVILVWICRDETLVQFYLETYEFDPDTYVLVYYTGKHQLSLTKPLPPQVLIFEERPDMRNVICNVIHSIESEDCLHELLLKESEVVEKEMRRSFVALSGFAELEDPVDILRNLLERSLQVFKAEEILERIHSVNEIMDPSEFIALLQAVVPEIIMLPVPAKQQEVVDYFGMPNSIKYSKDKFEQVVVECLQDIPVERVSTKSKALYGFFSTLDTEKALGVLARWNVLYCGGSKALADALKKVCLDFGIAYSEDDFDW